MLKLIIVDDEKIIRETIFHLIQWNSLGIEVIGLCKNGDQAFEMIQDEYPDIVMTDIKMPGLSGLDLIRRTSQAGYNIEFVILSGYGEFSYAKEAMEWGVKHYLLKPTNESQIIGVMKKVIEQCYHKKAFAHYKEEKHLLLHNLHESIIRNILSEGLANGGDLPALCEQYGSFADFEKQSYELCFLHYLQEENLKECLDLLFDFKSVCSPGIPMHIVYVRNTLIVFFEDFDTTYDQLDRFMGGLAFPGQEAGIQYKRIPFPNLEQLLRTVFSKLKRYEKINIYTGSHWVPVYNYNTLFQSMEQIAGRCSQNLPETEKGELLRELKELLNAIEDPGFLKTLVMNVLLKQRDNSFISGSPVQVTEFLLELNQCTNVNGIRQAVFDKLPGLLRNPGKANHKGFIEKLMEYVQNNLKDPDLSLKMIADNYLFMHVDYVSKQFVRQTGCKFSTYLNQVRIDKAKELLLECPSEKICSIAEEIGYGNNPHYFSQVFRKHTNMTPTEYVKRMRGLGSCRDGQT